MADTNEQVTGRAPRGAAASSVKRKLRLVAFVLLALGLGEAATRGLYARKLAGFEATRLRLLGASIATRDRCVSQPYLGYVPAPGYSPAGVPDHSEQGYRGRAVPLRRKPGTVRILCLGGSTTYGLGIASADEAYPAQLEAILAREQPEGVSGVEVINAGLPSGTTAELYTHYHFKFHYLRPDLVIIDPDRADAEAMLRSGYQPDYGHWREVPRVLPPLPKCSRWLMHSRLASLFCVLGFLGPDQGRFASYVRARGDPPPVRWYPGRSYSDRESRGIAFSHNLATLASSVARDSAQILLVPGVAPPNSQLPESLREGLSQLRSQLEKVAAEHELRTMSLPQDVVSPASWSDGHLNAGGHRELAKCLAPEVRSALGWP